MIQECDIELQAGDDQISEESDGVVKDTTHYHNGTEYVLKKDFEIHQDKMVIEAEGVETVKFTNIPEGTEVTLSGVDYWLVNDGELEYDADKVGNHIFVFRNFKYTDLSLTVSVV